MKVLVSAQLFKYAMCTAVAAMAYGGYTASFPSDKTEAILYSNQCLIQGYDFFTDLKLKTWDLRVTDDLFIHLNKKYENGKHEYFSLCLKNFNKITLSGTAEAGILRLNTDGDDVIKQTFHDPEGDIDTLLTSIVLPIKNMRRSEIDSLSTALVFLRQQH